MGSLFRVLGIGVALLVVVFAGWYFKPWSEYSPHRVISIRDVEDRTEAYRSMETIYPYRAIAASQTKRDLPRRLQELDISYTYQGAPRRLADYAGDHAITGLMVVQSGDVVFETYWRGATAQDLHTSWSVAKSVVATLVGMALKEGKIDSLDDKVEQYAPLYQGTDYGQTTIRHLLMMSSGINFIEDYETPGSDMRKLFFNAFILQKDIDKFVRQYERNRSPGEDFDYLSPNTSVLGAVLTGAYNGQTLSSLVETKLFDPLGMGAATWLLDRNTKNGKELAYCCLNMRLEDYAKFGLLYLADGMARDERLLPDGWVEFVSTPPQASHAPNPDDKTEYGYGHHFWVPHDEGEAYFAAGYNGQYVWIDPARDVVVAMTGADQALPGGHTEFLPLLQAAAAAAADLKGGDLDG